MHMLEIIPKVTVTNEIARFRREILFTQAVLAHRVGVSRQTIYNLEKGTTNPSLEVAFRLAAFFEVNIETLFHSKPTKLTLEGNEV